MKAAGNGSLTVMPHAEPPAGTKPIERLASSRCEDYMRAHVLILAALAPSLAQAVEAPGQAAAPYAAWQKCLHQNAHAQAHKACASAETAYLKALTASPLLDASDALCCLAEVPASEAKVYTGGRGGGRLSPPSVSSTEFKTCPPSASRRCLFYVTNRCQRDDLGLRSCRNGAEHINHRWNGDRDGRHDAAGPPERGQ